MNVIGAVWNLQVTLQSTVNYTLISIANAKLHSD